MSKRPPIDLMALTSEQAVPMSEAAQRSAPGRGAEVAHLAPAPVAKMWPKPALVRVPTENLEGLAFKVSPDFRKRFRSRAAEADLKLNELLFEAFDAWELTRGLKG